MHWVLFTLFAAFMQSVRTAGQKRLAQNLSVWAVTYARFVYGLPFALIALFLLKTNYSSLNTWTLISSSYFFLFCLSAGIAQILATYFSVALLGRRNFVTGSTLIKCEAVFTAILGVVFFAEHLSFWAWFAVLLNVIGLVLASVIKQGVTLKTVINHIDSHSAKLGLFAGFLFAVASVSIRQASLSIDNVDSAVARGVLVLCTVLVIQVVISLIVMIYKQKSCMQEMILNILPLSFIGLTSMLGSFGWFVAYSLQNAALVKVVGQVDFLFMSLITIIYFKEKVTHQEWLAMSLILSSIILLLL